MRFSNESMVGLSVLWLLKLRYRLKGIGKVSRSVGIVGTGYYIIDFVYVLHVDLVDASMRKHTTESFRMLHD